MNNEVKYGTIKYFVKVCRCSCKAASNCIGCAVHVCKNYVIVSECNNEIGFFNDIDDYDDDVNKCKKILPEKLIALELKYINCVCFEIKTCNTTYAIETDNFKEME